MQIRLFYLFSAQTISNASEISHPALQIVGAKKKIYLDAVETFRFKFILCKKDELVWILKIGNLVKVLQIDLFTKMICLQA